MAPPLKILHVVHSLEVGGLENGLINLVNRLDGNCFWHTICCLSRAGKIAERIERNGVEIVELGLARRGFRFPVLALKKQFQRIAPDVVHTRGWGTIDAVFAAKLARVPRIIHGEHGRDVDDAKGFNWRRNKVRRIVSCLVERYVVVCDFFRVWLRDECRISERKIIHITNGTESIPINLLRRDRRSAPKIQEMHVRRLYGGNWVFRRIRFSWAASAVSIR
jgi:glycosyltransferase involved in cell wall biosynthesis